MTPTTKFHRGDRVIEVVTGQRAVVEGWKGDKVFVLFGVDRGLDYRGLIPWYDLVLDTGQNHVEALNQDGEVILP